MRLVGACVALVFVASACSGAAPSADPRPTPAATETTGASFGSPMSCGEETTVSVSGRANVFAAGVDELPAPGGGGGGVPPVCVAVPVGASSLMVPFARGSLSFTPLRAPDVHFHKCPGGGEAILAYGPDGNPGGCPGDVPGGTILPAGAVSGIASRGRAGYLVGVFLPTRPRGATPPATLDFGGRYDFHRLAPALGQLFFVGDGRTVTGSLQAFRIPTGATRLYLGIADAFDFRGPPGSYDDNRGRLRVRIRFE